MVKNSSDQIESYLVVVMSGFITIIIIFFQSMMKKSGYLFRT